MYNVGPDFTRSANETVPCEGCSREFGHSVYVHPAWNGYDGVWECPECGEELDFVEGEE